MQMQMILPKLELHKIENEFVITSHAHEDQFQLNIPIHGTCFFTHENKEIVLAAGEGLLLHPRDKHSFSMGEDSSLMIIRVNDQSIYPTTEGERKEPAFRQQFDPIELSDYFKKWMIGMFSLDRADRFAMEEMECQVLGYLHRLIWGASAGSLLRGHKAVMDGHLSRVMEYIHTHYTEQMNIDALAAIALQSRFHFIRSFKAMMGVTPYQYILHLRVEQAKLQLQRTSSTVTDISYSLGFSSTSQFYRTFLKSAGMTPEKYRSEKR